MRAIYKKSDFREGTKKSIPKVAATTDGRSRGIRTLDLLVPNQSRYQAALCSAAVFAGNAGYYIS